MKNKKVRPIALYLPQFHRIPENDRWWGQGFTEWTNVKKAVPSFKGHYQPHVPHESIGYYDLRNAEVLNKQAIMAEQYGIFGFCFYHYWFNGKRLLNLPIDSLLSTGNPNFPFCLCWANENWTRRWDGMDKEILVKQNYSHEDDRSHINFLFQYFNDPRYIKVDGKPLFIIYRPELFPDIQRTMAIWREEAEYSRIGELYLCYFEHTNQDKQYQSLGFDAAIEFQPHWSNLRSVNGALQKLNRDIFSSNIIVDYSVFAEKIMQSKKNIEYKRYPSVFPMWDNSARRKARATIFKGSTPETYGKWLNFTICNFRPFSNDENFIFINAWNEWAEGNHLEPCQKWGLEYLEKTLEAVTSKCNSVDD